MKITKESVTSVIYEFEETELMEILKVHVKSKGELPPIGGEEFIFGLKHDDFLDSSTKPSIRYRIEKRD